jgi:DNA-binding MarR family transcriptional regulator
MINSDHNLLKVEAAMNALRLAMVGARERMGEGLQITRTQLEILMLLSAEPQTTGELAQRLFLTQSAVTQTLDTLVRRNLVERLADENDRRITRLQLSPSGRNITSHHRSLRHEFMQAFVSQLTEPEIENFISVTSKLTQQLKETKLPKELKEDD